MRRLRIACLDFWRGFEPGELVKRFPELGEAAEGLGAALELTADPAGADLLVFSTFPQGRKTLAPRDPHAWTPSRAPRLFYTGENVDPDFSTCDFAMSFRRDLDHPNHLRVPNYVTTQRLHGFAADALLQPPADPAEVRRSKTRFCAYVQRHRVPMREEFVRKLAEYKRVDCAGPSLHNTGFRVTRAEKYGFYRECKFAICFENEAEVGYTTEKLPDALLTHALPIYWGDPTVHLDFNHESFVHARDYATTDELIQRIIELDRDDDAYDAVIGARRYPDATGDGLPKQADPAVLRAFFERVIERALERRHAASA